MIATGDDLLRVSVGLEELPDGIFVAYALDLPGASARGDTPAEAVEGLHREVVAWLDFLEAAGERVPSRQAELVLSVDEWIRTEPTDEDDTVPVLFAADLAPLTREDAERCLHRLGELRRRLLSRLRGRRDAELDVDAANGMTVRQSLDELARWQWWALTRLGASPMAEVPEKTLARLDTAMALVVDRFTTLPDERRAHHLVLDGEEWTPRKVMRRVLWLEWNVGTAVIHALDDGTPLPTRRPPAVQPDQPPPAARR